MGDARASYANKEGVEPADIFLVYEDRETGSRRFVTDGDTAATLRIDTQRHADNRGVPPDDEDSLPTFWVYAVSSLQEFHEESGDEVMESSDEAVESGEEAEESGDEAEESDEEADQIP